MKTKNQKQPKTKRTRKKKTLLNRKNPSIEGEISHEIMRKNERKKNGQNIENCNKNNAQTKPKDTNKEQEKKTDLN